MKTILVVLLLVSGSVMAQNELFIGPVMEQMMLEDEQFEAEKRHKEQTEEMRLLREEMEDLND
jgi:hypothetical protein